METQSSKDGAGPSNSFAEQSSKSALQSLIHPFVHPELKKHKPWLSQAQFKVLETDGKPLPNFVFDCLEVMLLHHLAETDNHDVFIANHGVMTDAIDSDVKMSKSDLYAAIRQFHEFVDTKVVTFAYGETRHNTNSDGHWVLFSIDFSCDTVFVYDSCNRFKGVDEAFQKLRRAFIAPHLCYLEQHPGPLDKPERGIVADLDGPTRRASQFKLQTIFLPVSQKDLFSCGLWVSKMLLQIVMEKRPLTEVSVAMATTMGKDTADIADHRNFLARLMQTRNIYVDEIYPKPEAAKMAVTSLPKPSKSVNNEEEKGDDFRFPLNKRNLKQMEKEASVIGTMVSTTSNKTASGAIKRHCEPCKFKLVGNWSKHKKDVHAGMEVASLKCVSPCSQCTGQDQVADTVITKLQSNKHEKYKEYQCGLCKQVKESRRFPKGEHTICYGCSKKPSGSSSVGNFSVINDSFNEDDIGPNDSVSMIGTKRKAAKSLIYSEVVDVVPFGGEETFSVPLPKQEVSRKQNTLAQTPLSNSMAAGQVVYVSHTDSSVLSVLRDIETCMLTSVQLSLKLQEVCKMLTQDIALQYLSSGQPIRLPNIIAELLSEAIQLTLEDRTGLLVASFILGGACWSSSVKMIGKIAPTERAELLSTFTLYIMKLHSAKVAKWITTNWKAVDDRNLQLINHLRHSTSPQIESILNLSLGITLVDIPRFVECADMFVTCPAAKAVLECLANKPKQQKLSFDSLLNLIGCVRADANQPTIIAYREQLVDTPLSEWIELIETNKAHLCLMDADSIQSFINELIEVYGEIDPKLIDDLTRSTDQRFGLLVHLAKQLKPNNRQFALAQYCVGQMSKKQRQLWCVPCGQGKSRISATVAAIAHLTRVVDTIYIVHENSHLMERDQKDFQVYWTLLGILNTVIKYQVGLDFAPEPNSLIIFDEADVFMLRDPVQFTKLINGCFCICFSATPDNCDAKGAQRLVVNTLQFSKRNYVLDAPLHGPAQLEIDEVVEASSTEEKADYIVHQLVNGPVLAFCDPPLAEQLSTRIGDSILYVNENTDYNLLRALDKQPFKLVVAQDEFAMRGIDYRCEKATMTLAICKPFTCTMQALQGLNRVGRFGDECKRIKFKDVMMIDQQCELELTAKLFEYISSLQKTVQIKKATARIAVIPKQMAPPKGVSPCRTAAIFKPSTIASRQVPVAKQPPLYGYFKQQSAELVAPLPDNKQIHKSSSSKPGGPLSGNIN